MQKGRKCYFLPFALFCLSVFSQLHAGQFVFKGFLLQDPYEFLCSSEADISAPRFKEILEQSGFFRQVDLQMEGDSAVFTVDEYPAVSRVMFGGNTIYHDRELIDALELDIGRQFNSRRFAENLQKFYRVNNQAGYTHWQVAAIEVQRDGSIVIGIDEGIFQGVLVEDDIVDQRIVRKFFSHLLGKPFNARKVSYVLEELLFTEAFYTIHSEVLRQDNRVILKIIPEKKKLRRLKSYLDYSNLGGFRLYNSIGTVTQKNRLNFLDIEARFVDHLDSEFVQLSLDQYNFRRNLSKSFFSNRLDFFYTSSGRDDNFYFRAVPSFSFPLFRNLLLSLSAAGGIHKNFSGNENELIAEASVGLDFYFQSSLNRTEIVSKVEWTESILYRYSRKRIMASVVQRFLWGELDLFGQWSAASGEEMPFNHDFIPFEKVPLFDPETLYVRDLAVLVFQVTSRPLWGFLRMGIPVQVVDAGDREWAYGLTMVLTARGFPIRLAGFIRDREFYWSAGTRLSF